jgi:hypothetical protein
MALKSSEESFPKQPKLSPRADILHKYHLIFVQSLDYSLLPGNIKRNLTYHKDHSFLAFYNLELIHFYMCIGN